MYAGSFIDDTEFLLLYVSSYHKQIYSCWKIAEFRKAKNDTQCLTIVQQITVKINCFQRTVSSNIEGICMFLKRLAYPFRLTDTVPIFGRDPTEIHIVSNFTLDFMYPQPGPRMSTWNPNFLPSALSITFLTPMLFILKKHLCKTSLVFKPSISRSISKQ